MTMICIRMKHPLLTILLLAVWCTGIEAQEKHLLNEEAFLLQVKQYHPVAKQADLLTERAAADLQTARGAFDPLVTAATSAKTLDGVSYYQYTNPELKIPTAAGLSLKAGYEKSDGQYINPERTRGVASYLGVELPLLNGLLTDKRRTALKQAAIYTKLTAQERLLMINDLLFEARTAYWEWAGAWYLYRIYTDYIGIAAKRARLVKLSYQSGDRSMADTVEAWAQLQNVQLMQSEALLQLAKKALDLSAYLWTADESPYQLPDEYMPDSVNLGMTDALPDAGSLLAQVNAAHPAIRSARYKLDILEAERRLKRQNLLPVFNLQANLLSKDYYRYDKLSWAYLDNNYKFGVNLRFPLLLRQERGEYKASLIKIRDNRLGLQLKQWELENKVKRYYQEASLLRRQLQSAVDMKSAYMSLLKTEELKFGQGESSVFLVNARENKLLETQQKVIELQVKHRKAMYAIQWAAGLLPGQ